MSGRDSAQQPIVVGRIGGAYGVLGWVRIVSFTEPPENLFDYGPWLLESADGWTPVRVASARPHAGAYVAQIREVSSREQAQALAGRLVAVPADALPALDHDDDGYYWRDLAGLEVRDTGGQILGRVDHLFDSGAHDVLVIDRDGRQMLVPFLGQFVVKVDLAAGYLVVDWQEPV